MSGERRSPRRSRRGAAPARLAIAAGFTLIEVMVALVIVALGMTAVHMQVGRYATSAARIEEKTLASWIATNKLTELSIAPSWPELGDDEEEIEFAGRYWICRTEVSETEVENLRRVDVFVSLVDEPDHVVHQIMGLVEPPAPRGFAPLQWLPLRVEGDGTRGDGLGGNGIESNGIEGNGLGGNGIGGNGVEGGE